MKFFKYFSLLLLAVLSSCTTDSEEIIPVDETGGLIMIQSLQNDTHLAELYSERGELKTGYNEIVLRIKNKPEQEFVTNAKVSWNPVMHMEAKEHSAPKSEIAKVSGKETLYKGFIIFQMPENETEYWSLSLNYSVGGENYSMEERLTVSPNNRRKIAVFQGIDAAKYILALVEPKDPKMARNDMTAALFKMENMHQFTMVDNYRILIDPRMPGMDNHSSPNNEHLSQKMAGGFYHGKLNLTMSGYWKINLQLENSEGEILKGETVEEGTEVSSIFFELEF
jgi:hypothetical protein